MNGGIRSLRRRIKSITSTEQMTKAMKTVAVSKYNHALARLNGFGPYADKCRELLLSSGGFHAEPKEGAENEVVYVLLTANRGLCGAYNLDLMREAERLIKAETRRCSLVVCGKWGADYAASKKLPNVIKTFVFADIPEYEDAAQLTELLCSLYLEGRAGEVCFISQHFKNILTQIPTVTSFLPKGEPETAADGDYIYVPDRDAIRRELTRRCLNAEVYKLLLSAASGAHGAMLIAMRTASDNSTAMLSQLELKLNRMRQSAVTTEVLELSGGSDTEY